MSREDSWVSLTSPHKLSIGLEHTRSLKQKKEKKSERETLLMKTSAIYNMWGNMLSAYGDSNDKFTKKVIIQIDVLR